MKTKDFIKMLQEADPEGEGFIRLGDGAPWFAESKEGYWDGYYEHYDTEEKTMLYSIAGYKVDIHCMDTESFVHDHADIHDPESWEKIKAKLSFDFGNYAIPAQRQEKIDRILASARKYFDEYIEMCKGMYEKNLSICLQRVKDGWRFYQNKKVETGASNRQLYYYYHWKIVQPGKKPDSSCVADTEPILKSGLFERLDHDSEYYEWKLKTNNE